MRRAAAVVVGTLVFSGIAAGVHRARAADAATAVSSMESWCTPGQGRRGELTFEVNVTPPGAKDPLRVQLAGQWHSTSSTVRGAECDVAHELTGLRAAGSGVGQVPEAELAAWQRRLQGRFWITYRRDGAVLRAHFPKELEPGDRNVLQMIVTGLQVVRPARDQQHWTALERDAAGQYLADYQRTEAGHLLKRKLTYTMVDAASGARAPEGVKVEIVASEQTVSFDERDEVSVLEGVEHLRIGMPFAEDRWLQSRTTLKLREVRREKNGALAGSLERARAGLESVAIRTHNPDPGPALAKRDAALLEGHGTQSLLAAAQSGSDDKQLSERLAALFRRRPEAVGAALALARTQTDARRIAEALATAGKVNELGALAKDLGATEGVRVDALNALVLIEAPSVDTMQLPRALLDDAAPLVRRAALLSSGALARAGRREHPAEAEAIDRILLARYAAATDDAARLELLSAAGNSAGPLLLPLIDEALRSERSELRAAAVTALRLSEEPEIDARLAQVMTTDADARVRAAGLFAASFRPLGSLFGALEQVATNDPAEALRRDASALLRRAERRPTSRP